MSVHVGDIDVARILVGDLRNRERRECECERYVSALHMRGILSFAVCGCQRNECNGTNANPCRCKGKFFFSAE